MKKLILVALLGLTTIPLTGCAPLLATGVGAGVLLVEDRRTSGTYLMDEEVELKTGSRIRENFGEKIHANVTSYNRRVLLTGEVPDAATRAKVEDIAKNVPNVGEVQNELVVGDVSGFMARSNDGYITAKVKARFLDDKRFNAHHVKVVTEANPVFLMGMVKREEGNAAAEIAARTGGVSKVVKIFEYLD
jgi:osmotically-inducible protein OsmY